MCNSWETDCACAWALRGCLVRAWIEHLFVCRSWTVRFRLWYSSLTCLCRYYSPASLSCHAHSVFCVSKCLTTNRSKYFMVMVAVFRTYQKQQVVRNFLRFVLLTDCDILLHNTATWCATACAHIMQFQTYGGNSKWYCQWSRAERRLTQWIYAGESSPRESPSTSHR